MNEDIKFGLEFWIGRLSSNDFTMHDNVNQINPNLIVGMTATRLHVLFDDEDTKEMKKGAEWWF
ncbi:MAG: hypothetical protein QXW80_05240 [Candidatus Micrarchaeia archaeon]